VGAPRGRAAFRIHLASYLLVNGLMVATWAVVWMTTGFWYPWWVFCAFGWGIGVGIHGYVTYRGDELSQERIRAEMNRIAGG